MMSEKVRCKVLFDLISYMPKNLTRNSKGGILWKSRFQVVSRDSTPPWNQLVRAHNTILSNMMACKKLKKDPYAL